MFAAVRQCVLGKSGMQQHQLVNILFLYGHSEYCGEKAGWWGKRKVSGLPGGGEDAVICLSQVPKDLVVKVSLNFPYLSLCQTGHYARFFKAGIQW